MQERAVDGHRKIQPCSLHERGAIDVSTEDARRDGRVDAALRRGHAQNTEEGVQVELVPSLAPTDPAVRFERPLEQDARTVRKAESIVQRSRPVGRCAPAPRADDDSVDPDLEDLARARATHFDRTDESVAAVELRVARLEVRAGGHMPPRIQGGEGDRVARINREDRLEIA